MKIKEIYLKFAASGPEEDEEFVDLGSILDGGIPIVTEGYGEGEQSPQEGDDREFLGEVRVEFTDGSTKEYDYQ